MAAQNPTPGQAKRPRGRPPAAAPVAKRIAVSLDEEEVARFLAYRTHVGNQLKGATLADAQIAKMLLLSGLEAFEGKEHPDLFRSTEGSTTRK